MDDHAFYSDDATSAALRHVAAAILSTIDAAGPAGVPLAHVRVDLQTHGASLAHCDAFMHAMTTHGYLMCDIQGRAATTSRGHGYVTTLRERLEPAVDAPGPKEWEPIYTKWRHGGWYVMNVEYPSRACGCVSRNYPDGRWRIVCDERRTDLDMYGDVTFPNRDAAAHAEHALAMAQAKWVACDADPKGYLLAMFAPPAGLEEGSVPLSHVDPRQQRLFD